MKLNINLMTTDNSTRYHELIQMADRTKEQNRELEQLKKLAKYNTIKIALENLLNLKDNDTNIVNVLEYENMPGMYRIQTLIKGKFKTVARVKASYRDIHIAIRETTARELNKEYVIVNYNLPAQFHIEHKDAYNFFKQIIEYHYNEQTV